MTAQQKIESKLSKLSKSELYNLNVEVYKKFNKVCLQNGENKNELFLVSGIALNLAEKTFPQNLFLELCNDLDAIQ